MEVGDNLWLKLEVRAWSQSASLGSMVTFFSWEPSKVSAQESHQVGVCFQR